MLNQELIRKAIESFFRKTDRSILTSDNEVAIDELIVNFLDPLIGDLIEERYQEGYDVGYQEGYEQGASDGELG